jgi:hypothetical protein
MFDLTHGEHGYRYRTLEHPPVEEVEEIDHRDGREEKSVELEQSLAKGALVGDFGPRWTHVVHAGSRGGMISRDVRCEVH